MKIREIEKGINEIDARNMLIDKVAKGYLAIILSDGETVENVMLLDYNDLLRMGAWEAIVEAHLRLRKNSVVHIVADEEELQDGTLADLKYWPKLNRLIERYHKRISINCCYMDIYGL